MIKKTYRRKLGQIGSNLIIRIPSKVDAYMDLRKGDKMTLEVMTTDKILIKKKESTEPRLDYKISKSYKKRGD
jgi:bifunctional DNA-binding transcriptional regulator/antitoxin component of YhaV-PrlF toxin-antitoxin module